MLSTDRTADVTSKNGAGEWALGLPDVAPRHGDVIRLAMAIRSSVDPAPVDRGTVAGAAALVDEVVAAVTGR